MSPYKSKQQQKEYIRKYMREYRKKKEHFNLQQFFNDIRHCINCKTLPAVFVTSERIPLCLKHWKILSNTDVEWLEDYGFTVT